MVPPPTEVPTEETLLDAKECATLHEEGLDERGDSVDNNDSGGNGFRVVWEEEEAHVTEDSRATNGIMSR